MEAESLYVRGSVNISNKALETLETLGIKPPHYRGSGPFAAPFDSFYIPAENVYLFHYRGGKVDLAGYLCLKDEV